MTDQISPENAATSSIGRLLVRLATEIRLEFRTILANIARDGDVELIREIHRAGVLTEDSDRVATLPLALHAADQMAGQALVREIISSDGAVTDQKAANYFRIATKPDAIAALAKLGFDPNRWMDSDSSEAVTPLARHISKASRQGGLDLDRLPTIMALLEEMRKRDVVPLVEKGEGGISDFFKKAVETSFASTIETIYSPAISELMEVEWPDSWRRAVGEALIDGVQHHSPPDTTWQSEILARLLSKAKFDDAAPWGKIFSWVSIYDQASRIGNWLCDLPQWCGGVAVLQNLFAHGVQADDFSLDLRMQGRTTRGTLLHCALVRENALMTEALLDSGASPDAVLSKHPRQPTNSDVGLSAIEVAQLYFPEAVPMLHAKKAKDTITRTLEQAAKARLGAQHGRSLA